MNNYELLKPYYSTQFKEVFFYHTFTQNDILNIKEIIEVEKSQGINLDDIEWLYSANDDYYLIGIHHQKVVTYTSDGDYEEITDNFAMLPFILMWVKDAYSNVEEFKAQLVLNPSLEDYLNNLVQYAQWCKEQGINIPYEYIKWIE